MSDLPVSPIPYLIVIGVLHIVAFIAALRQARKS